MTSLAMANETGWLYEPELTTMDYMGFQMTTEPALSFHTNLTTTMRARRGPCPRPWTSMTTYRLVCEVFLTMPISLLGILGNLLSFIVLCKQKQRLTTRVLLQGLAVADTLILISYLLIRSLKYFSLCLVFWQAYLSVYKYLHRWIYPCVHLFRFCSTWMTCLLTVDRYIAVCHPLQAQRLCTLSRAYKHMTLVVLVSVLFSFPRFFESYITEDGRFVNSSMSKNRYYTLIYKIGLFFIFMYIVPMLLLIVLNTKLLRTLRRADSSRAHLQSNLLLVTRNSYSINRCISTIVLTVVIVCIVCNTCAMVSHILYSLPICFEHLSYLKPHGSIVSNFSNVVVTINSAINFVIYCLCSRNFRQVFLKTLKCGNVQSCMSKRNNTKSVTPKTSDSNIALTYMFHTTKPAMGQNGCKTNRLISDTS